VIDQRIRDMLSLWTCDGSVTRSRRRARRKLRRARRSFRSVNLPGSLREPDEPRDPLHFVQVCCRVVPACEQVRFARAGVQDVLRHPRQNRHRLLRVPLFQRGHRSDHRPAALEGSKPPGLRRLRRKGQRHLVVLACKLPGSQDPDPVTLKVNPSRRTEIRDRT